MRLIKILCAAMLFSTLIIISMVSVTAADEQQIITDPQGDVIAMDFLDEDYNYTTTEEKPNIDINKLTYNHISGSLEATIILEVYGDIEDRGSLNQTSMDVLNSVIYTITLETSNDIYSISYSNKECQLYDSLSLDTVTITGWTVNNGMLTIPITLASSTEQYLDMNAETLDTNIDISGEGTGLFVDIAPDEIFVDAYGPYEGKVGESIQFTGEASDILGTSFSFTYEWDFGDGSETSSKQNPTHVYDSIGNYTVTLTVEDDVGNSAVDSTIITISEKTNNGNGNGGEPNQDGSDSGLILFFVLIAIIVIIGVVALVFIIRR